MVAILNYKMTDHIYIVTCGTIGFLDPENIGIDPEIDGLAVSGAEILINEVYGGGHFTQDNYRVAPYPILINIK